MVGAKDNPYGDVARKWLALTERRYAHLAELSKSGRWKHYYTPPQLLGEMLKTRRLEESWAKLARRPRATVTMGPGMKVPRRIEANGTGRG
jgi:hypothetical protein